VTGASQPHRARVVPLAPVSAPPTAFAGRLCHLQPQPLVSIPTSGLPPNRTAPRSKAVRVRDLQPQPAMHGRHQISPLQPHHPKILVRLQTAWLSQPRPANPNRLHDPRSVLQPHRALLRTHRLRCMAQGHSRPQREAPDCPPTARRNGIRARRPPTAPALVASSPHGASNRTMDAPRRSLQTAPALSRPRIRKTPAGALQPHARGASHRSSMAYRSSNPLLG